MDYWIIGRFWASPIPTQPYPEVTIGRLGLYVPSLVRPGEDVTADNANGGPGQNIVRIMLAGLDSTVSNKGCGRVGRDAILPPVTLSHKLSGRERNRRVC